MRHPTHRHTSTHIVVRASVLNGQHAETSPNCLELFIEHTHTHQEEFFMVPHRGSPMSLRWLQRLVWRNQLWMDSDGYSGSTSGGDYDLR